MTQKSIMRKNVDKWKVLSAAGILTDTITLFPAEDTTNISETLEASHQHLRAIQLSRHSITHPGVVVVR